MTNSNFGGLRVLALESRRASEIAKLISNFEGVPMVAPSVREVPLEANQTTLDFANKLANKQVDMIIFMTGGGVRMLAQRIENIYSKEQLSSLLNGITVVARGPKPVAALRELGVRTTLSVPEPNTWRDLLAMLDEHKEAFPVRGCQVALQEYGVTNPELLTGLAERGAIVTPLVLYEWALPEDIGPLQNAVASLVRGEIDVMLVASSVQIRHLFQVAETLTTLDALREALSRVVIVSIGPLTSEELRSRGLNVDLQCAHPKMGYLVKEAAENSNRLTREKRGDGIIGRPL